VTPDAFSGPRETALKCAEGIFLMKHGDHVKVIGEDGFFVFLKEFEGTATVRLDNTNIPKESTLAIPINQIITLEKAN
jgi:hypothetical protein